MKENLFNEFVWWVGVIEDINDPKKVGRCKVRCFGYHTTDMLQLPTSKLPWASTMNPVTSASVSGVGYSPTGLVNGSYVVGFFLDGTDGQTPVIMGSFAGVPDSLPVAGDAFNDPNGVYPTQDQLNEPDVSRLARNENTDKTLIKTKKDNQVKKIPTSIIDKTWEEPVAYYNASYPNNKVYESPSGHVIEYDDTPGHERIHVWHKSGSYKETNEKGDVVTKTVGNGFQLTIKDNNIFVGGDCNITIDGNANIKVKGNVNELVSGDVNKLVEGNYTITSKKVVTIKGSNIILN